MEGLMSDGVTCGGVGEGDSNGMTCGGAGDGG